jgi:predicted phage terminase large subunit-like protein
MLDADTIKGFVGSCLLSRFDSPTPIPSFHEELWDIATSGHKKIAIAAPRGHAKSTSMTLSFLLASVLFRESKFVILVSDTEGQARLFLNDIKIELEENEDIIKLFGVARLIKDTETDVIVEMDDGHQFRIIAKGSEQKVRGLKWRSLRPDLIVGDDLENDEIVMNKDRREKFRTWFRNALVPCLAREGGQLKGKIVVVGTILHMDSMLERLLNDPHWYTARYAAHNEDFTEILWPEQFSQEGLEEIRDEYVLDGNPAGYSQEYLNYPIDESTAYFRRDDFKFFNKDEIDYDRLSYYAAIDLAISEKEKSDFTVIVIVGVDHNNNLHVVDVRRGRWDGKEIIDEMMSVQSRWNPEIFSVENGQISKSLLPFLKEEMMDTGVFINTKLKVPVQDKESRARSIQARIRQGTVYFDGKADWYANLESEMVRFPRDVHDDQVDALAWVGLTLSDMVPGVTKNEFLDLQYEEEFEDDLPDFLDLGANPIGGY